MSSFCPQFALFSLKLWMYTTIHRVKKENKDRKDVSLFSRLKLVYTVRSSIRCLVTFLGGSMRSLRIRLLGTFVGIMALCTILFTAHTAYAAPFHQSMLLQPSSSEGGIGGGCSGSVVQGPISSFAKYGSCISEGPVQALVADAYFTFGANNAALWSSCTITFVIVDSNQNNYSSTTSVDCLRSARNNDTNQRFDSNISNTVGNGGHGYYTKVSWIGIYNGKIIQGINLFSPEQFV